MSRALENAPQMLSGNKALREYYLTLLDQLEIEFAHVHHLLKEIFASAGTRVLPMTDLDHFRHFKTFLNPSLTDRFDFDAASDFQPELSIQENCWNSEGNGQSDFGFYLDGHYHSVLALTRWPRTTYPGIIQRLTNLRLLDYTITVNIDPLPITREINKEEKEHDRVAGDYASEKKISLLTVMEKKQRKIHALMQGQTIPFNALFVTSRRQTSISQLLMKPRYPVMKEPRTSREVRNLAFAYFSPEEFPTHRMLQELMMLDPVGSEREQILEIATLILPWCRDGNYGCLFDRTSNLSLTGKIAHFELGYIPGVGQGAEGGGGLPHNEPRAQAYHYAPARAAKAQCV